MKGRCLGLLRRLRSARGFTMTETLLGVAVTGLLVAGVCAAVVNSAASTKETDVVEFFDGSNQNAIAAFRTNAEKAVLMSADAPEPFGSMKQEKQGENTVVFTGYYDSDLKALPTTTADSDTKAAYKVVYTATFKSEIRENFDFTESEVKLDIANYERNSSKNGWILREHNQNMEGSTGSGDATTVRVLSLSDDSSISDLDPKDPEIEPVIPVEPVDYQNITLRADLTYYRNYWDITKSKVDFIKETSEGSGNEGLLRLTSTAESITKAGTAEKDQNTYKATIDNTRALGERIGSKPTNIIVEVIYDYVNIRNLLSGSGYTIKTSVGTTNKNDAMSSFDGTGATFATSDTALENLKKALGIENNGYVTLTITPVPQEVSMGGASKITDVTYAVRLMLPSAYVNSEIYDKIIGKGPFTIGLKKNGVKDGKLYYKVAIYNKDGKDIMGQRKQYYFGQNSEMVDHLYFGFGTKEIDNVTFYIYVDSPHETFRGPEAAVSTKTVWSGAVNTFGMTRPVSVREYKNMTNENSDVQFTSVFFCQATDLLSEEEMFGSAFFWMGENNGWWKGSSDWFGTVVDNSKLTWYAKQTEPQYQEKWKDAMKTFNVTNLKDEGMLPHLFELKKT